MLNSLIEKYGLPALVGAIALAMLTSLAAAWFSGQLKAERARHDLTRQKLAMAVEGLEAWRATALDAEQKNTLVGELAQACLDRERRAKEDAAARAEIMRRAKPRELTEAEKKEIIDDDTRKAAMDRLNRPL